MQVRGELAISSFTRGQFLVGLFLCAFLLVDIPASAQVQRVQREVRVGVYQNPPKILLDSNGQPSGILGDLIVEIGNREGWTIRSVPCEWQACLNALQAGSIDLMPDLAYTPERAERFDMHTTPALLSWSQIYKARRLPINSIPDLAGRRIAVLEGSIQHDYLGQLLASFGVDVQWVPVQSLGAGFEAVAQGHADVVAGNRFFGETQGTKYGVDPTPILFQPAQLFYAATKGRNGDLLATIERYLTQWQKAPDSPHSKALERWLQLSARQRVPAYLWWGLGLLSLVAIVAVAIGAVLKRQVSEKTHSLRASEERLATILNSVDAYIYIKDSEGRYEYVNRKLAAHFGVQPENVIGTTDESYFDEATSRSMAANDRRVLTAGERVEEEETTQLAAGGSPQTMLSIKLPLRTPDGDIHGLCGISTDITRHKKADEAIHQLAFFDPLTQLPNRRLLMDRLQQVLANSGRDGQCGALLFIDVDNFKDLNDTLGHDVGDLLLSQIARRLELCMRSGDTVARQGGDEFVVLLPSLGTKMEAAEFHATTVAQKLVQQLGAPYQLQGRTHQTTVSVGVAMFCGAQVTRDDLFRQADLAMYRAKTDGRNAFRFFNPEMQARVSARTALESDLQHALVAGQFLLHYQVQVDEHGHSFGVEALVRWQHPERGLVSPGEFIPIAEASALIVDLGRWIIESACRQLAAWKGTERDHWSMAVNVSARQFRQPEFVETVQSALQQSGVDGQRLELELTESLLVEDVDVVASRMSALKAMGVRLSLDDFGTGYSSLSLLRRLPLDQLKIDQSFVRDLLDQSQNANIVKAILTLGASLRLNVIAEGVETQAQRDKLFELGCRQFQGYFFGRPGPLPV